MKKLAKKTAIERRRPPRSSAADDLAELKDQLGGSLNVMLDLYHRDVVAGERDAAAQERIAGALERLASSGEKRDDKVDAAVAEALGRNAALDEKVHALLDGLKGEIALEVAAPKGKEKVA